MQTWYLIIGIGTLLIVTIVINNIAESIERRSRQRKLEIFRLKRNVDILTDFLEELKGIDLPKEILTLLQNEILSRLQKIQTIDRTFHGIADLIAEAKKNNETTYEQQEIDDLSNISESELQNKLTLLRQLTGYLQSIAFLTKESLTNKSNYNDILVIFRFEKLSHFYTRQAQLALQNNNYKLAKEYIEKISRAIIHSGNSSQRMSEIRQQALYMMEEINQQAAQFLMDQEAQEADQNEQDKQQEEEEHDDKIIKKDRRKV